MRAHANHLVVPPDRREAIERIGGILARAKRLGLCTHVNADGDGCGSEAGLALLLGQRGVDVRIVNPTPWPDLFRFVLADGKVKDESARGAAALKDIDSLAVLDISDVKRLGALADAVRALDVPKVVIDHHVPSNDPPSDVILADTAACATGELIYDFACVLEYDITPEVGRALYTAILTDTGGFRFSNTSPRCHAVASQLLAAGVNPEEIYQRVYASAPVGRLRLLAEVLQTLEVDDEKGLTWLSMDAGRLEHHNVRQEDLDGIVEMARSVGGTKMALFFRDLGHGKVKVSFRSTGSVDVNAFARQFGGGGHARASGALIKGSLDDVRERVLAAARAVL